MTDAKVFTQPFVVRESVVTAHASLTGGTNTTLLAGDNDSFLDLVFIGFSNNSDAAVTVTLSEDGTTIRPYSVPVVTATQPDYSYAVPIPQSKKGGNWQVDMPDISGTTLTVRALFIKR